MFCPVDRSLGRKHRVGVEGCLGSVPRGRKGVERSGRYLGETGEMSLGTGLQGHSRRVTGSLYRGTCWQAEEGRLPAKPKALAHAVLTFHTHLSLGNLFKLQSTSFMQHWAMSQLAFRDVSTAALWPHWPRRRCFGVSG